MRSIMKKSEPKLGKGNNSQRNNSWEKVSKWWILRNQVKVNGKCVREQNQRKMLNVD